jgi:hypothetical protein
MSGGRRSPDGKSREGHEPRPVHRLDHRPHRQPRELASQAAQPVGARRHGRLTKSSPRSSSRHMSSRRRLKSKPTVQHENGPPRARSSMTRRAWHRGGPPSSQSKATVGGACRRLRRLARRRAKPSAAPAAVAGRCSMEVPASRWGRRAARRENGQGCGEARRLVLGDAVDGERTPLQEMAQRRDFWGRAVEPSRRVHLDVAAQVATIVAAGRRSCTCWAAQCCWCGSRTRMCQRGGRYRWAPRGVRGPGLGAPLPPELA